MGRTHSTAPDPVLERLREVAERIRQRAAEGRAHHRGMASDALPLRTARRIVPSARPGAPAVPRHWSDGREDELDDRSSH